MTRNLDYALEEYAAICVECLNCESSVVCNRCPVFKRSREIDNILAGTEPRKTNDEEVGFFSEYFFNLA